MASMIVGKMSCVDFSWTFSDFHGHFHGDFHGH